MELVYAVPVSPYESMFNRKHPALESCPVCIFCMNLPIDACRYIYCKHNVIIDDLI